MNNQNNFMVVQGANLDENQLLGKFVYYSLPDVLVDRDDFARICISMNFPYAARRISVVDAFKNATGRVTRSISQDSRGAQKIFRIYCRDNMRDGEIYSRELVRETVGLNTNHYEKLANVCYDRNSDKMFWNIEQSDPVVDVQQLCEEMEQRFNVYRNCLGRSQIDTIVTHYLSSLDSLPISIYGKLYFVPRHQMHRVDLFEDFLDALNDANRSDRPLVVNSFFVVDDDKQREKMTAEFYALVRREAQEYQERAAYLINNGNESPAILERWVKRIRELEEKKQRFEALFRRELDETDSAFDTLRLYSQELQVRAMGFRKKAA